MKKKKNSMNLFFKKTFYAFVLGLLLTPFQIKATPISPDSLIVLSKRAFLQKSIVVSKSCNTELKSYSFLQKDHDTLMLVANFNKGFVIMAAEKAAIPVLAYSLDQNFDMDNMPPAVQDWLNQYEKEIASLKRNPDATEHPGWAELQNSQPKDMRAEVMVSPFVTSLWNQGEYYNKLSPIDPESPYGYDNRTPCGCAALAMSMIMYYYRYPSHGYGSHTNHTTYGNYNVDFSQQNYCYEAMEDELNGMNNEVAKLIFHCATSIDMMYGPDGSGAISSSVPNAMVNYFGYSSNLSYLRKEDYNDSQWIQMLKNDLNNGRPIYYAGYNDEGGHAFICDGYDSDNHFHFNFGWGGSNNGFYTLDVSESSDAVGGFSNWQRAIVNIYPDDVNYPFFCNDKVITCSRGTVEDGSNSLNYQNNSNCTYVITEDALDYVTITFQYFDTEFGHDSLSFWDGNPQNGHLLRTFSGENLSLGEYSFFSDSLYITFKTDGAGTAKGWRFQYETHRSIIPCEYSLHKTKTGTISDGSGEDDYLSNSNCIWRIWPNNVDYLILYFSEMDISPEDELCIYSVGTGSSLELVATLSGNQIPEPLTINHNRVQIVFKSDNYLNAGGFTLSWVTDSTMLDVESNSAEKLLIYPNPASDKINVSLPPNMNKADVVLYDVAGKILNRFSTNNQKLIQMDVSSYTNGVYFLKIFNDDKVYLKKIVVGK